MSAKIDNWARGYAKQALSDLDARESLVEAKAHKCHRLHFLQMAAEEVCKSYLIKTSGHDREIKTHACVQKHLPAIARNFYTALDGGSQKSQNKVANIKHLAHEIELLSPARDEGGVRKDSSEYPWDDGTGKVCVPCEYSFPNIDDAPGNRKIIPLIRLIREASELYSR